MTNAKSTKRALLLSVTALFLCFAMLVGTTYAWFTDSAISSGNKIKSGTLDVELYKWTDAATKTPISSSKAPVFDADIVWEPGYTEVVYLSIKNNGTLTLKYKVAIDVTAISEENLAEVMEYAITPDAKYGDVTAWAGNGTKIENAPGINPTNYEDIELAPGAEHFFALSVHMLEEAGNEYKNQSITFDIKVLAGQATEEVDGTGSSDYDKFAGYPGVGYAAPITGNETAKEIQIVNDEGYKVGSVLLQKDAVDTAATQYTAKVTESDYEANITVDAGLETVAYDVTVEGLKDGNTTPVKVMLRIKPGLDPNTVKVYHYDELIDSSYDPNSGYVTFETTSFSPFTIVHDVESVYVPPVVDEEDAEEFKAIVNYAPDYVGEDKVEWGSYGQWSPSPNLSDDLEAAFTFQCPDYETASDEMKAVIDAYRHWYCDFYVSLDTDLGTDEIFLGGYYAQFGAYVGFHNGEFHLDANTDLPLLASVTTVQWTYEMIEKNVGTFVCGVGDVDNALEGQTFTVKLRLINPEKVDTTVDYWWTLMTEDCYVDVNVVTYTFGGAYTIDGVVNK